MDEPITAAEQNEILRAGILRTLEVFTPSPNWINEFIKRPRELTEDDKALHRALKHHRI